MPLDFIGALQAHARERGGHPAIVFEGQSLPYAALLPLIGRTAAHLSGLGIGAGSVLGIALRDEPAYLVTSCAALWLGAAALPLDWRMTPEEQRRVVTAFGASLILMEEDRRRAPEVPAAILDTAWHQAVHRSPEAAPVPRTGASIFFLGLSSGTTGAPKAGLIDDDAQAARFGVFVRDMGLNANDRFLSALPLQFGINFQIAMACLHLGATAILFPPLHSPDELVAGFARSAATASMVVPATLRTLLKRMPPQGLLLPGLRALYVAGDPLHPEEVARVAAGITDRLMDVYGSRAFGCISVRGWDDHAGHPGTVGRPVSGARVEIVGEDGGPVAAGETGLLRAQAATMARRILGDDSPGLEGLREGWFYTGDFAAIDAAGFIQLRGRISDLVKRGGARIFPAEIERVLLDHPAVGEAAVVGIPAGEIGDDIVAFVALRGEATAAVLTAHCRRLLSPAKQPQRIVVLPALPKNAAGKVVKRALAESILS